MIESVKSLSDFVRAVSARRESWHVPEDKELWFRGESKPHAMVLRISRSEEIESAFSAIAQGNAGALFVFGDAMFFEERKRILTLSAQRRLPTMYAWRTAVEDGGLMGYQENWPDTQRRAAVYVDKILRGARPGDLPVEQPTKYDLFINLKTAKALNLTIPPSLLQRADQVIE